MQTDILKGKKILIVEDDLPGRLYLNKILEKTGAVLLNAGDGKEAVKFATEDPEIEIILMDIQLPVMDGYTAANMIRKCRKEVKIVAQTAYGLSSDMEKIMASGFDDSIIKPIYSSQLIEKLSSLFSEKK